MHRRPALSIAEGGRGGVAVEPRGRRAGQPRSALPQPRSQRPPGWPRSCPSRPRPRLSLRLRGGEQCGPSPRCPAR
eukprot:4076475-Pyramimonas_sp.AAC.1